MRIFVGNLSYSVSSESLRAIFEEFGTVISADVIMDRYTNRSRGFGFVDMPDEAEAMAAIEALNGREIEGRTVNVNKARPREERPRRDSLSDSISY